MTPRTARRAQIQAPGQGPAQPPLRQRGPRRRRSDDGAAALELVLMAPLLMAFIVVVVAAGRIVQARGDANDVAYAAARAASLASTPALARGAAEEAARAAVDQKDLVCRGVEVSLEGSQLRPGGQVTATVRCTADLADVAGFGIPSSRNFVSTAQVPIETYREFS